MIKVARVKKLQDMPEGVPCCAKMMNRLLDFDRPIQVSAGAKLKKTKCQDCGKPFMGMRVALLRGWRIDPRAWDIADLPTA